MTPFRVVAVPGLGLSVAVARRTLDRLPGGDGAVVLLPGFGRRAPRGTPVAPDRLARLLLDRLPAGGPAVLVGHSIAGGAVTIAAATAPELVSAVVELAPFTRKQSIDLGGLLRVKRFRAGYVQLAKVIMGGSVEGWKKYLDVAMPVKPADWPGELARIVAKLSEPGRMNAMQSMCKSSPADAGEQLPNVKCPVLVIEGSLDPDWADPRAEGDRIIADLPAGLGELAVIEGAGHYPHVQTPDEVLALTLPFLARTLTRA